MRAAVRLPDGLRPDQALFLRIPPQGGVASLGDQAADGIELADQRHAGMTVQGPPAKRRAIALEVLGGRPDPHFGALGDDDRPDVLRRQRRNRIDPREVARHERGGGDPGALVADVRRRRRRRPRECRRSRQRRHELGLQGRQVAVVQHVLAGLVGDVLGDHGRHERRLAPDGVELFRLGRAGREAAQPGSQRLVVGRRQYVGAGNGAEGKNLIDSHGMSLFNRQKASPRVRCRTPRCSGFERQNRTKAPRPRG
ncbi:hypothetical protein LMG3482_04572 [Achromobacter deleyi]|nr:hypothetical protein LMG3482_04572 [Achromobacter deleyi]